MRFSSLDSDFSGFSFEFLSVLFFFFPFFFPPDFDLAVQNIALRAEEASGINRGINERILEGSFLGKVQNAWRGMLVTQLATSVRNVTTEIPSMVMVVKTTVAYHHNT